MRDYEATFILNPALSDQERKDEIAWILSTFEEKKGIILKIDESPRRRFPYEIQKKKDGYFVLVRVTIDGQCLSALDRLYRIRESIMRHMIVVAVPLPEAQPEAAPTVSES